MTTSRKSLLSRRLTPAGVALLYATFAVLWIVVSGYLLTITVHDPLLQSRIELVKGLVFVAITSILLYLLLRMRGATSVQVAMAAPIGIGRLLLIFAALVMVIPLIGFAISSLYAPQIEREAYADLEVIARLKAEQIENWLDERNGDSAVLAGDDAFVERVDQFVQQEQDAKLSRLIRHHFEHLLANSHYSKILLFNTNGRLLLSSGKDVTASPVLPGLLRQALASKQVQRRDLYRDAEGDVHLEWATPLVVTDAQGKRATAVVVLRITAQSFIFPLIKSWPTVSASGETLLVRRDGDSVLFLNQLRHRNDDPMTFRLPLATSDLPAAIAIRENRSGTVAGIDYRGVPVLAAHRPVAGTSWHIVAKLDRAEVLAPLRDLVLWVSLIALVAIAAVSTAVLLLWRQQQRANQVEVRARSMTAIEESERRYRAITQTANDALIIADSAGNVVGWNPSAARLFGYSEVEILGQPLTRLIPERFRDDSRTGLARVASGGEPRIMGKTVEFAGLRKDGGEFPLELSLAQWQTAAGLFFSATIRDITERKHLEQQLAHRLRHLDVMERITRISLDSKSIEALLGRVLDEMLAVFNADRAWFLYPCDPDAPSWSVPIERTRPEWPGAFARGMAIPMTPGVAEVFREVLASTEPLPYGPAVSRFIPAAVAEQFSIRSQIQMALRPRVGSPWVMGLHHCAQARAYTGDELQIFKDIGQRVADALSSMIILKNLRESEENLNRAQAVGQIGSWLLNTSTNRLEWSAETYRMFGVAPQQAVDFETFVAAIHPDDRDHVLRAWDAAMTGAAYDIEHRIVVGGQVRWVRERAQIERDPEDRPLASIGTVQDITERKAAETTIQRLTQLYAALSQCNQAIVRSTSEDELFPQICRDAVQFGGMKMAWIGLLDGASRKLRPVASYGAGTEYLEELQASLEDDGSFGCGLTRTAIRENQPCWSQDFQHDPLTAPLHARAARLGWCAAASLPLRRNGAVIGAFTLYSGTVNALDADVRKLLVEMAVDIGFALDNFALEAERKRSEQVLAESEQRFRGVVEQSLAGIYIVQDGRFVYVNPRCAEIFGYATASELIGVEPTTLVAEQDRAIVAENTRSRIGDGAQSISYGFTAVRKDGSLADIGVHGARATHGGHPAIIGLMQDVSEKKRAEEQIQRYIKQLETAFMHTVEVATTLVELRDPYTAGHEKRVAQIAAAIGTELGLDAHRIEGLRVGGYIHDIGKIIIPAEILSKPGRLSAAEYELIKGHPLAGYNILKDVDFPWPVADIAYQHHERMDGSGYPRGLKGEEIMLEARIIAVADVIEAMSSHRPYRPGIGIEMALAEIERGSGDHYDPQVVAACLRLFHEKGYVLPA